MAAQTAARWPISQMAAPTTHSRNPKPDGGGEGAVEDRDGARRAAQQDRLGQRAMDGRVEPRDRFGLVHQTSAPPPNWKKVRKKLEAAKAIAEAEDDLDQPAEAAGGFAEGERQACGDDDDHRDYLGDRTLDRIQDLGQRLLPRHVGAGGIGRRRGENEEGEGGRRRQAITKTVQHQGSPAGMRT